MKLLIGLRQGGTFLLNSIHSAKEIINKMPNRVKKLLASKKAKFYVINATKLARDLGLGTKTNTIMQSAFFKLANVIEYTQAKEYMKEFAKKSYESKGDAIVKMNFEAIENGANGLEEVIVDSSWLEYKSEDLVLSSDYTGTPFVENFAKVVNAAKGDTLPVSIFTGREDGTFENGTTKYEKRAISDIVPMWIEENCIQCNQCAFECPHAVIRPFLLDDKDVQNAPQSVQDHLLDGTGKAIKGNYKFKIQVSISRLYRL